MKASGLVVWRHSFLIAAIGKRTRSHEKSWCLEQINKFDFLFTIKIHVSYSSTYDLKILKAPSHKNGNYKDNYNGNCISVSHLS